MLKGSFPVELFRDMRTPFYFYDIPLLRRTLDAVQEQLDRNPDYRMHYAVKANFNPGILAEIAARGFGADCVSGGEVKAAIEAGFPAERIVYAGVGKSDWEILLAIEAGISRFNVESEAELCVIDELAGRSGRIAPVSLRINPDIGAHTHAGITTGLAENKFGICYEQLDKVMDLALNLENVRYCGLHFHIGSQILDMADFTALCNRINELVARLQRGGRPVGDINVGGGLGINYQHPNHLPVADFGAYFDTFRRHLHLPAGTPVHFELGRSLVAPCGSLISRVLYVKQGMHKQFCIIDGSMTELVRPAMYRAWHRVENISSDEPEEIYDVVGPVCESSDVFAREVSLDKCRRGDFVAIRSAGAYGESMASHYNCHPLPASMLWEPETGKL